jgi:hypothetical protein
MGAFYIDPWGLDESGPIMDSYSTWVPEVVAPETPSYTITPSYVTAVDNSSSSPSWSLPTLDSVIKPVISTLDYGLKAYGQISAINNSVKDQELNNFLKKAQVDVFKTQALGAMNVNSINAKTAANIAQAKANLANTMGVAGNLGASVNGNSLMLWLTIAGVALAFIQVSNTAK